MPLHPSLFTTDHGFLRKEEESYIAMAKRIAVVTGGNKGIGFEICKQLAANGILVILTARDETRGRQAVNKLKDGGDNDVSDNILFHQLDVADSSSISSLAHFVQTQFAKLDILVNNAGVIGTIWREGALKSTDLDQPDWQDKIKDVTFDTYELAEECLKTNYYGAKGMVEALLPLLQLSDSPRIVNVSSTTSSLTNIENEWAKGVLSDVENLTEERVEQVIENFLKDFKADMLKANGWPFFTPGYVISKAALNAYTRIVAKRYPSRLCINAVCPGFVKTDINVKTGTQAPADGAKGPVKLALLPDGGPSGRFFSQTEE
ncbi:(+)-neomenthol dehydrogenase, partial [Linum grandiflorum]